MASRFDSIVLICQLAIMNSQFCLRPKEDLNRCNQEVEGAESAGQPESLAASDCGCLMTVPIMPSESLE